MLATLYPLGFGISLVGLISWFYVQGQPAKSRLASIAFLGGFFIYLASLAFADIPFSAKLFALFRDLVVLAVTSQFVGAFKQNKIAFALILLVSLLSYRLVYWNVMQNYLHTNSIDNQSLILENPEIKLDENAEILVSLKNPHNPSELLHLLQGFDAELTPAFAMQSTDETTLDNFFTLNVPANYSTSEVIKQIEASKFADWVEPNEIISLDPLETHDPQPSKSKREYGINDTYLDKQWSFEALEMDKLFALLQQDGFSPKKKSRIAILDTGIDAVHEDIADNYKTIQSKYDHDKQGHGTHCAGIAAAVSNNGKGIASFSHNNAYSEVSSIQVLNGMGSGTQQSIINGILEAADQGVDVISMSLGGVALGPMQKAYDLAIAYANKKGAIVVVAAGNSNRKAQGYVPASCKGVITVTAVDGQLNKAVFSNTIEGIEMAVAAPGVDIFSTKPNNEYLAHSGTSMATPHVAGLLALMRSLKPELSSQEAYEILRDTGKDTNNSQQTGKFIQPAAAIAKLMGK